MAWNVIRRMIARSGRKVPAAHRTGQWGESVAEQYLRRTGYRIIGRRVRIGRRDEIDLIARRGQQMVFIEVKTRRSEAFGRPAEAVRTTKRRAMTRAAMRYMQKQPAAPLYFRFDVIEVVGTPDGPAPIVRHLENVFTPAKPWVPLPVTSRGRQGSPRGP